MSALRWLNASRSLALFSARRNIALASSEATNVAPPPQIPTPTTPNAVQAGRQQRGRRRRKRKIETRRPSISTETPRKWNRPLAEGVLPAYDLALQLIQKDSGGLKLEARALQAEIDAAEAKIQSKFTERDAGKVFEEGVLEAMDQEIEDMRKRQHILEVQSEVNFPSMRWQVTNAMVDMTKPSHRHLLEQRWRKEGALDLLMERVYQMHVVPDILPEMHPSVDLRVTATALGQEILLRKTTDKEVEPGVFLLPHQTLNPPKLYANVFHTDTRFYTMLLVDLDVPDQENAAFTTFLHWMKPNIPLSAIHRDRILDLNTHTAYIPPHPQHGTPYHRYVFLLLPHPPASGAQDYTLNAAARASPGQVTSAYLDIPVVNNAERKGFDIRAFMQQWGLDRSKGGGIHMFRQIWNESVSKIYKNVLGEEEPRYGRPRKPDPYAKLKQSRRYV
ncbi:phosphatidylethanolamine-binding protein [Amanita rubescens]|nr:phosphatidylethanolamine-binding protein [Amanita rubescens]KAF8350305.1 phosphatidylethanolamine-binding protein [Amanita rubescens]